MRLAPIALATCLMLASPLAHADVAGPCGCSNGSGGAPYDGDDTGDTGDREGDQAARTRIPVSAKAGLLVGVVSIAALARRRPGATHGD